MYGHASVSAPGNDSLIWLTQISFSAECCEGRISFFLLFSYQLAIAQIYSWNFRATARNAIVSRFFYACIMSTDRRLRCVRCRFRLLFAHGSVVIDACQRNVKHSYVHLPYKLLLFVDIYSYCPSWGSHEANTTKCLLSFAQYTPCLYE